MIDKFSKERFEAALTLIFPEYESLGLDHNEEVYAIPVNTCVRIKVRSSIDQTGYAADSGDDSIRLWVEVYQPNFRRPSEMIWAASGKKVDAYTTRVSGWEDRMEKKIRMLWDRASKLIRPVNQCPECNGAPFVGFVGKDGANKDRPFASHRDCNHFEWLDEPYKKGDLVITGTSINSDGNSYEKEETIHGTDSIQIQNKDVVASDTFEREDKNFNMQSSELSARSVDASGQKSGGQRLSDGSKMHPLPQEETATVKSSIRIDAEEPQPKPAGKKLPNPSQQEAITMPVEANVRLMAPPGSGKTFVIEHRYQYLVEQGVDPANILVVTFSKPMADEMTARISKTCRVANKDQISTIHAFCYRVLSRWYPNSPFFGWQVPKDWQVKKILDELVEEIWQCLKDEEKPGYKEVLTWLDNSKFHALKEEADYRNYFVRNLGARYGDWLADIRTQFDRAMSRQKFMRFADMLYQVELMLIENEAVRSALQKRFSQVIVDECQDTSYNAMRILITVAGEPGSNPIYSERRTF